MFGVKGFTSVSKPRKYQYIPRFYSPDKEVWEKKKAEYRARGLDYGGDEYQPGSLVKRRQFHRAIEKDNIQASKMAYVIRFVSFCLLAVIVILLYKFFF